MEIEQDLSGVEAQGAAAKESNNGREENSFGFISVDHCPYGPGPLRDAWLRGFGAEEQSDEAADESIAEQEGRTEAQREHDEAVTRRQTAANQVPGSIVPPDPANAAPAVASPPAPVAAPASTDFPSTAQEAASQVGEPNAENVISTPEDAEQHAENVLDAQNADVPPLAPEQGQIQPGDAAADGTAMGDATVPPKDDVQSKDETPPAAPASSEPLPSQDADHLTDEERAANGLPPASDDASHLM